jgi:hypothetical protein
LVCNTMVPSLVTAKVHQLNELNIEKWRCYQPRMVNQKTLTKTILGLVFYSDKTDWLMLCKFPDPIANMDQAKDTKRKMENWKLIRQTFNDLQKTSSKCCPFWNPNCFIKLYRERAHQSIL